MGELWLDRDGNLWCFDAQGRGSVLVRGSWEWSRLGDDFGGVLNLLGPMLKVEPPAQASEGLWRDRGGDLWAFRDGRGSWVLKFPENVWSPGPWDRAGAERRYGPLQRLELPNVTTS